MKNRFAIRRLAYSALIASGTLLVACGGDDRADEASNATSASALPRPETATLPQYQAWQASTTQVAGGVVPDAAALAALVAAQQQRAVAQLLADLASVANGAVVPPLTDAALRSLGAAASGDSLAQISAAGFDLAPTPYMAALLTSRVASQWWADRGRSFRTDFLAATDAAAAFPRLAAWSAAETGFADASAYADAGLGQALDAAGMSLWSFEAGTNIRLLALNTVSAGAAWGPVNPVDGIFQRVRLPLLRISSGVRRHAGADFTADLLAVGDLRLLQLRPGVGANGGTVSAAWLTAALAQSSQALLGAGSAALPAGELLLPQATLPLPLKVDSALRNAGVQQLFDKVNANLKGLDGVGGTYAQSVSPNATLVLGPDGLALRAAHAMAFTFSPLNINGPGGNFGLIYTNVDLAPAYSCFVGQTLTWPTPDLRPFYLALLDARGVVVALAAFSTLPGTAVTPTCETDAVGP